MSSTPASGTTIPDGQVAKTPDASAPSTASAAGGQAQPIADKSRPLWNPPVGLVRVYLLIVSTFGIYALFWVGRFAADLRRHVNPKVRPALWVLGSLLPFVAIFVGYRIASQVAALNASHGQRIGPNRWVIVALIALSNLLLTFLPSGNGVPISGDMAVLAAILTIVPVPWLLLQRQLNGYKARLEGVNWAYAAKGVTVWQGLLLALGLVFWVLIGVGLAPELQRWQGERLQASGAVQGASRLYSVTPAFDGWVRMPPGSVEQDADLELYGPTSDTMAVAYVLTGNGRSVDEVVDTRRALIEADLNDFTVEEFRVILPDSFLPVSYARYEGNALLGTERQVWWVATIAGKSATVEVIARTTQAAGEMDNIEALVRSLTPTGEMHRP